VSVTQTMQKRLKDAGDFRPADMKAKDWIMLGLQGLFVIAMPVWLLLTPGNSVAFVLFLASLLVIQKIRLPLWARAALLVIDLAVVMPIVGVSSGTFARVATMIGIYAILSMGLNIVVGYTGLLNLGYAAFYAVGAYLYAIFATPAQKVGTPVIHHQQNGLDADAQLRERILHLGRHHGVDRAGKQTVLLQLTQLLCEHFSGGLRNQALQLAKAKRVPDQMP